MMLEAVWLKDGKEVHIVGPVLNIVCDDDMKSIHEIEIGNWTGWCSVSPDEEVDDFIIRIKKD